jgi:hypothetical protein
VRAVAVRSAVHATASQTTNQARIKWSDVFRLGRRKVRSELLASSPPQEERYTTPTRERTHIKMHLLVSPDEQRRTPCLACCTKVWDSSINFVRKMATTQHHAVFFPTHKTRREVLLMLRPADTPCSKYNVITNATKLMTLCILNSGAVSNSKRNWRWTLMGSRLARVHSFGSTTITIISS